MPEKFSSAGFVILGVCVCCNFRATQDVILSNPPAKDDFQKAKKKLVAKHAATHCYASMIAIGLTKFDFERFKIFVKSNLPISYYLYGK